MLWEGLEAGLEEVDILHTTGHLVSLTTEPLECGLTRCLLFFLVYKMTTFFSFP